MSCSGTPVAFTNTISTSTLAGTHFITLGEVKAIVVKYLAQGHKCQELSSYIIHLSLRDGVHTRVFGSRFCINSSIKPEQGVIQMYLIIQMHMSQNGYIKMVMISLFTHLCLPHLAGRK